VEQPGALAGGEADAVGGLAELAVELHLPLPVRLRVGHGAGEGLQAVLMVVARHRLAAGHALAVQADVYVVEHLGAGPHDLDGAYVAGSVWPCDLADERQVAAGAVQEVQADAAGIVADERLAVGEGEAHDGALLAGGPKVRAVRRGHGGRVCVHGGLPDKQRPARGGP